MILFCDEAEDGWAIVLVEEMDAVHVLPVRDLKDHFATAACACDPDATPGTRDSKVVVVHNAWDGRE